MIHIILNLNFGIGGPRNESEAKALCSSLAKKGIVIAQAILLHYGWNCKTDDKTAFNIFKEYYEKDQLNMEEKETKYFAFLLGRCHQVGSGNELNIFNFYIYFFLFFLFCFFVFKRNTKRLTKSS
jgi:hypothetical protein